MNFYRSNPLVSISGLATRQSPLTAQKKIGMYKLSLLKLQNESLFRTEPQMMYWKAKLAEIK